MTDQSMFSQYEQEFLTRSNAVRAKLQQVQKLGGEPRKMALREAEREIENSKTTLRRMEEIGAGGGSNKEKQRTQQQLCRGYQQDVIVLQREIQHAQLMPGPKMGISSDFGDLDRETNQRNQIENTYGVVQESGQRLDNAHRIALETENIGTETLNNLGGQRKQLEKTRDYLDEIDQNLSFSQKILNAMNRRIITNKLILVLIILVLLASIGLIVYFKWVGPLISKIKKG